MYLNLGCGPQVPDGWVNVDYALGARVIRLPVLAALNRKLKLFNVDWDDRIVLHNLTTTFPWPTGSVDVVYSSHTLEHMNREQGRRFLAECHRVLKDNGVIRIVVPDLRCIVDDYLRGELKADDFVEKLDVLYHDSPNALKRKLAPFVQFPHQCMYDNARLEAILREIGFDARVRGGLDSDIPNIDQIELRGRTEGAAIVEGRKRALRA